MIAALIIVYLYNFKMLPVERSFFEEEYITNIISFLNIGLTGFIVASLSARFVYPSVGAEGGAFYIIRSSPISLNRFLLYKYLYYVLPFTGLALLMVIVSDHLLNITGPMWWFSVGTTLLITWTVVAMALGFGALHADFKAESKAAALGGMGAVLFLFTAMAYEIIVISLGFFPAYKLVGKWLRNTPITFNDLTLLGAWLLFSIISGIFIAVFFFRKGVENLQVTA
jgi:ABC-2 type transport system permease protein